MEYKPLGSFAEISNHEPTCWRAIAVANARSRKQEKTYDA